MTENICFLTYMARSGSTLLARELDRYKAIGVTIEENIPDGLLKGEKLCINNIKELDQYLHSLYEDEKYRAWNIDKKKIRDLLLQHEFPILLNQVIKSLHQAYFSEKPQMIIHKKGRYYLKIHEIRKLFPNAKFLHIDRDPRAIYNSQKEAKDSATGEVMCKSIVAFALSYKLTQSILKKHNKEKYLHLVYYENFLNNIKTELEKVLNFFEIHDPYRDNHSVYYQKIPETQKYLHKNIEGSIFPQRSTAWKNELENEEIFFLQSVLKKDLKDKKYAFVKIQFKNITKKLYLIKLLWAFYSRYLFKLTFPYLYKMIKRHA